MPYASVTYTATNGQTVFGPVTFPGGAALQSSHIKVYLNGSLVTTATVSGSLSAPSVTLASGATAGDNVRIERQTPTTAATRLVDFEDGDVLTASDLDTAMLNNLYVAQEANDVGANGLPLDPVNNVWNAGGRKIVGGVNPSASTDFATKGYVDSKAFMDWNPNAITPTIVSSSTVQVECRLTNSVNSRLNTINWTSASGAFSGNSGQNWFRINNNTGQTVTLLLMHSTIQWDLAGFNQCANPSPVPFPWATLDTVNYTNAGGLITLTNGSFHYFKSLNPLGSEWGSSPYNNFAQGVAGTRASWVLWFLRLS